MLKLLLTIPHYFFISLAGIIGFGLLVVVHEFGHFFFCKVFGVRTPTFSVGFGPKLLTKKIGQTEFAISAIPLGGYVEIAGLAEVGQGEQKDAHSEDKNAFSQKPFYQKFLILIGGITFNILFALCALWFIFMRGVPQSPFFPVKITTTVQKVLPLSPADQAGLKKGDKIITVNNVSIEQDIQKLIMLIQESAEKPITLQIERKATLKSHIADNKTKEAREIQEIVITPDKQGTIGIAQFESVPLPALAPLAALKKAGLTTWNIARGVAIVFGNLLRGRNFNQVSGPISIFEATIKGADQGLSIFLIILAIISINLAVINLIPLPIADGGQILIHTIEALMKKPIPLRIKEVIFMLCWALIIALVLFMSARDIMRLTGDSISNIFKSINKIISNFANRFK